MIRRPPLVSLSLAIALLALGAAGTGRAALRDAPTPGALTAGPLPPQIAASFQAVRDDRPPPHIVRGIHYVVSNENRHYLYRDALGVKGGVYVGVGTDQNYLLAGWQRPEVLVLMDFDQVVVDLHRVYRQAFLGAADPASFVKLWADARRLEQLISASPEPEEVKARMTRAVRIGRVAVHRRLARLQASYKRHKIPTFLDDPQQYAFLVEMFKQGRVFMVRGDLTADRSVSDIGAAARAHGLPVRVLYMSNAERYFGYNADFKRSMLNLPLDERSVVLRTSDYNRKFYQYTSQTGANFHAWLRHDRTRSARRMLAYKEFSRQDGQTLAVIRVTPDRLPRLPAVRAQPGDRVCCMEARRPQGAAKARRAADPSLDPRVQALGAALFF